MASTVRRIVGGVLSALGLVAAVPGAMAVMRVREAADGVRAAEQQRRAAEEALRHDEQTLRERAVAAAAIAPFQAALEGRVDGATLVDLFASEDWWRPYRAGNLTVRVIVGGELLASAGPLAVGTQDQALVGQVRRSGTASVRLDVGGRPVLLGGARVNARAGDAPVLIFAEPASAPLVAAAAAVVKAPEVPSRSWMGIYGGAPLALLGLVLVIVPGRRRVREQTPDDTDFEEPNGTGAKHPTLKFGTTARAAAVAPQSVPGSARPASSPAKMAVMGSGTGSSQVAVGEMPVLAPAGRMMAPSPSAVRDTDPHSPQVFGRYRLLERLGQGGMSDVFTAMAFGVEGFSRTFVLKRLRPELAQDREAIAQFVDEARLQASLVHSNIVPVFDFGRVGKEYFLTQEYIRGRDIVRLLGRYYETTRRLMDADVAYYIVYETLQALAYAHSKRDAEGRPLGLVHRDVSPANIMVSLSGEVKLFDFGIVKANGRRSQTQVGMVKGNANFMSPEQARGHAVDARSDLFSLALVLYYCLSNCLLYDGSNDLDVLYRAATGPTDEDRATIASLPEPAASVLAQALAVNPSDRFPDAAAFAAALEPHARGGKAATAKLMRMLFGDELQSEAA